MTDEDNEAMGLLYDALKQAESALAKTQLYAGLLLQYDPAVKRRIADARLVANNALRRTREPQASAPGQQLVSVDEANRRIRLAYDVGKEDGSG